MYPALGTLPPLNDLKDQAKRLRVALNDRYRTTSHSDCLEILAAQHGYRDWNTLHAAVRSAAHPCPYSIGEAVRGRYLGQPFRATILAVRRRSDPSLFRVTFDLDEPVDVVKFDSFSAFRKRITLTLGRTGRTLEKTSDGVPHMTLQMDRN